MNTLYRRSSNSLLKLIPVFAVALVLAVGSTSAQENLRALVRSQCTEWVVGQWTGTNSQGRKVEVEYEWALDGHVLEIELVDGQNAYAGLISLRPTDGAVIECGADNGGGMTRAIWREEEGALISERTATRPGGREIRVAVVSRQVDEKTFKATVHALSSDGTLSEDTLETVVLWRVAKGERDD